MTTTSTPDVMPACRKMSSRDPVELMGTAMQSLSPVKFGKVKNVHLKSRAAIRETPDRRPCDLPEDPAETGV